MNVNFNNLRSQAGRAYHRLATKLNAAINREGGIDITADSIQAEMDDLRMTITAAMCVYEPGNPEFADLGGEADEICFFNRQEDET